MIHAKVLKTTKVGPFSLTQAEYNKWRMKLNRMCQRKRCSGKLDVPEDIHKTWLDKGTGKEGLLESLIRANGDKDSILICACHYIPGLSPWFPDNNILLVLCLSDDFLLLKPDQM